MKIVDYQIVSGWNYTELAEEVTSMAFKGWIPLGGVATYPNNPTSPREPRPEFHQAMVKYEEAHEDRPTS